MFQRQLSNGWWHEICWWKEDFTLFLYFRCICERWLFENIKRLKIIKYILVNSEVAPCRGQRACVLTEWICFQQQDKCTLKLYFTQTRQHWLNSQSVKLLYIHHVNDTTEPQLIFSKITKICHSEGIQASVSSSNQYSYTAKKEHVW